ncbi:cytochrome c biogenesis protein ResB [Ectobacillus polymachus]|uniref:cytochrome c biogenesis protein ResB n=1 Tax=Ectobacillus polymachus TaxID=1508806 RepID=UPI003A8A47F7
MEYVTCECGHLNPVGTSFCENCGKPFMQDEGLLDMKYEGSARRSKIQTKTMVDRIWIFFSSVKVGVWLIIITLLAAAIGTIFPQQMYIPPTAVPSEFYANQYGVLGKIYYALGFHNLYSSWWFMLLIASIGISLVIASLDRVIPLYKALTKQGVTRHPSFLIRQRLFNKANVSIEDIHRLRENMERRHYRIRMENRNILAEKGRFSRWGPYVNHLGIIIFLIGIMLRLVPGMYVDELLWLREGETKEIPGTNGQYYLKNESFIKEVYNNQKDDKVFQSAINRVGNDMIPKNFQTNAVLYKVKNQTVAGEQPQLEKIENYSIHVNDPLKFGDYSLYQVDYKEGEFSKMSFNIENKDTKQKWGPFEVDLANPKESYDLGNGYYAELLSYFPDFYLDEQGKPNTKTKIPNNPAFVFKMKTPETPNGEVSFVGIKQNIETDGKNLYKISFAGMKVRNATALTVRKDLTLWVDALGGLIFMIGVTQGMYWNHRRIWIQRVNDEWWFAGYTNKNWFGFKNEYKKLIEGTSIEDMNDQVWQKETKGGGQSDGAK